MTRNLLLAVLGHRTHKNRKIGLVSNLPLRMSLRLMPELAGVHFRNRTMPF